MVVIRNVQNGPAVNTGGGSGSFANEPAGWTLIHDYKMDGLPGVAPSGSTYENWLNNNSVSTNGRVNTDATAPMPTGFSDNKYVRSIFDSGSPAGSGQFTLERPFAGGEQFRKLWLGFWLRHAMDVGHEWDNNPNPPGNKAGVKLLWFFAATEGDSGFYCGHDNQGSLSVMQFQLNQQDISGNATGVDRQMGPTQNESAANVYGRRGDWVKYEIQLEMNATFGTANGIGKVWIDGVQTHNITNLNVDSNGASRVWKGMYWNSTYGGLGGPAPYEMYQDMSHLRILGSN